MAMPVPMPMGGMGGMMGGVGGMMMPGAYGMAPMGVPLAHGGMHAMTMGGAGAGPGLPPMGMPVGLGSPAMAATTQVARNSTMIEGRPRQEPAFNFISDHMSTLRKK